MGIMGPQGESISFQVVVTDVSSPLCVRSTPLCMELYFNHSLKKEYNRSIRF
jgi:hypothetical protein